MALGARFSWKETFMTRSNSRPRLAARISLAVACALTLFGSSSAHALAVTPTSSPSGSPEAGPSAAQPLSRSAAAGSPSAITRTPISDASPKSSGAAAGTGRVLTVNAVKGLAQMVGFQWAHGSSLPADTTIEVRALSRSGWSAWEPAARADAAPDPMSSEGSRIKGSAEPMWFGESTQVEVRHAGPLPVGFTLLTINGAAIQADLALPQIAAQAAAGRARATAIAGATTQGPAAPFWFTRAQWGVDESSKPPGCETPEYNSTVKAIFVHHTVNANDYAPSEVPLILRNIFAYHTSIGYCDVAYHAFIDRFGQIWEGRAGGMDRAVLGGATGGFNVNTWAVSLIGDYDTANVPRYTYNALRDLVAWKAFRNHLNATGTTTLTESSNGPSVGARWPAYTVVTFNVISGHRDAVYTGCPGNNMYPLLTQLRRDVDARMLANPLGNFEAVSAGFNSVTVTGWAVDPETAGSTYVWVSVDGVGGPARASASRPDVAAALPGYGPAHGFSDTISAAPGARTVCVTAVNTGAGHDTSLGCRVVLVSPDPRGNLEDVKTVGRFVVASGWALDPETSGSIYVWVDLSGVGVPTFADQNRPDVAAVYPRVGALHGFSASVATAPGTYVACATAVNVGTGQNVPIGCRYVTVT